MVERCDYKQQDMECVRYKTDHGKHVRNFVIIITVGYCIGLQFNEYDKRP